MSPRSHRQECIILALTAVVAAIVLGVLLVAGLLQESGSEERWFRTTRSTNVEGMIVYYTLLERLGMPVNRSYSPLLAEDLDELDVLFLVEPLIPLSREEASALSRWVGRGGALVCTAHASPLLVSLHDMDTILQEERPETRLLLPKPTMAGLRLEIPAEAADLPLARDVTAMQLASTNALVLPQADSSREPVKAEHLLADVMGLRIAARSVGAGQVIVLADSSFLANGRIGEADNALAAVNLACYALAGGRGRGIAFDEYHFGFGRHESAWSVMAALLFRTSAGWAVLSITAAGLLFLAYKGRRFGTRRKPTRQRRRSKLEYVHSVGAAYQAAGADRLAFRLIFDWFRRKAAAFAGVSSKAGAHGIASALAARAKVQPGPCEELMVQCEAAAGSKLSPRRMSDLLSRLAQMEAETFHARPGSTHKGPAGSG